MAFKVKLAVGGIIGAVILAALFLIPTNDFFGIDSHSSESPSPIIVLNSNPDGFEINPIICATRSDFIEFQFDVTNKLDKDYLLEIHLVQNNIDDQNLSRQAILVETVAGKTTFENYTMPLESDMNTCVIELKSSDEIN